jgi:Ca-activated chloride channel homolog
MMKVTTVLLLGLALAGSAAPPQDRGQFRGGTDVVSIYATVIDKDRRLVPDLVKDDFEVTDEGKTQKLSFFSNEVRPFSVVIMLDRSGSMAENNDLVKDAVAEFIRHMLPDDAARIGSFSSVIRISPTDFTSDRSELITILNTDLVGMGASPVWTSIDRSITVVRAREGRRVVLAMTDGHDRPDASEGRVKLGDLMDRARTADVMIYTIGLPASNSQLMIGSDPRGRLPLGIPIGRGMGNPRAVPTKSYEPPDPALKDLAEVSGGGYFELSEKDNLRSTFTRVAEELHHQYTLGFTPTKLDGKVHEIEVKVKRRGVEVRARKHYVASRSGG